MIDLLLLEKPMAEVLLLRRRSLLVELRLPVWLAAKMYLIFMLLLSLEPDF